MPNPQVRLTVTLNPSLNLGAVLWALSRFVTDMRRLGAQVVVEHTDDHELHSSERP